MGEMFSQRVDLATVILVDGENIAQSLAGQIITQAARFGRAMVQRVYGDVTRLPAWEAAAGFEMIHTGCAKNAADIRMVIDALDLVHRGGVGRVVLASSDRDFTHLAQHLRARGVEVLGMGEAKTHDSFRKACSEFVELLPRPVPKIVVAPKVEVIAAEPMPQPDSLAQIKAFIAAQGKDGLEIQVLSLQMARAFAFNVKTTGYKTWRGYLDANPADFVLDQIGTKTRVRLKTL